ncbi:TauD/TfdA dioxygenase family protein [Kribbella sp. NPDC004536]|uniref:TauD/TfdA dioxygenase family protein n=1 Tax=Kribbella sp. NPDC004536 TaxID=3364106 RepID=UPI00368E8560
MLQTGIQIRQLTRNIGAEIAGVDISQPLAPADRDVVEHALLEHQVVFFREQRLDHATLKAFGRQFGELTLHQAVDGVAEHPEITVIHADVDSTKVAGDEWHSDMSCRTEPPMGSILYLPEVPAVGGDTLFASMYAAYDALSSGMQSYLEGMSAEHDCGPLFRSVFPDLKRDYPVTTHPVIRVHPVTGRKAIFVNSTYTTRIVGVGAAESRAILGYLYQHCADPMFQVRFRWQPNSVAFWDNRCTQHLAIWDYYPDTRSGIRVQIAGDRPY